VILIGVLADQYFVQRRRRAIPVKEQPQPGSADISGSKASPERVSAE